MIVINYRFLYFEKNSFLLRNGYIDGRNHNVEFEGVVDVSLYIESVE